MIERNLTNTGTTRVLQESLYLTEYAYRVFIDLFSIQHKLSEDFPKTNWIEKLVLEIFWKNPGEKCRYVTLLKRNFLKDLILGISHFLEKFFLWTHMIFPRKNSPFQVGQCRQTNALLNRFSWHYCVLLQLLSD